MGRELDKQMLDCHKEIGRTLRELVREIKIINDTIKKNFIEKVEEKSNQTKEK